MSGTDLAEFSAAELLRAYRRKQASPVEALEACHARMDAFEPDVNAFIVRDDEAALAQARAAEARWHKGEPCGLVDGVPATIKDLYYTKGWPTRRGSATTAEDEGVNEADAPCVARLKEQGAVLLGKTTTPEYGWKGVTDSPVSGITRNPWDTSKTPGGSSGGAAAAAALGMGALHIGSDGGGSIRIPAGFTGVYGIKPTYGRVPAHPPSLFGTIAHIGPITRTVEDAALMLMVISEPDSRDWTAFEYDPTDFRVGLHDGVAGLRIAYSRDLGYARVDPEIIGALDAAVAVLADLGAEIVETDPGLEDPLECFNRHWFVPLNALLSKLSAEQLEKVDPGMRELGELGKQYSATDFADALVERARYGAAMQQFFDDYDLLVTPSLAVTAFDVGRHLADPASQKFWTDWTPFTYPYNLTQQPACAVPVGFSTAGLPIGMQILGPKYADRLVLQASRAYEAARPFRMPEKPNVTHR
jgi:aspartyl-tRNA(Asn)/glutamyl-tRNA(Gln) amidotransferase subunit A